jgi:hypothetical protein
LYRLPVVHSTVNVSTGRNQPTIAPLQDVLPGITALDRTTINAWKDAGFKQILFGGDRPLAGASTEPAGNGVRAGR